MRESGRSRARQESRIAVGKIRRAHGVHGFLRFESFSGEVEHFSSIGVVELRGHGLLSASYDVEEFRLNVPTLLMKLSGVDDRDSAAALRGREIWVERCFAAPLGPNEYYLADLSGCELRQNGHVLGTVQAVIEAGAGDMLEAVTDEGRTVLVPFHRHFVLSTNVEEGVIELVDGARLQ